MTTETTPQALPRRTESGMQTRSVNAAAGVLLAAMEQGRQTPTGLALALDAACLLNSPEHAAEFAQLREQLAEHEVSPLAWARLLDAKSLDNFMCALGMAADTDPADGALSQVEEMIRSFREAVPAGAKQERTQTLHDHIIVRDAEIERLKARLAEYERPADEDPIAYALTAAAEQLPQEPAADQPMTVYRASHDSIVMGLYTTPEAARTHCEAEERRSWGETSAPTNFDWIEDEEDGVAEMTAFVGGEERTTGYVVTPLEVAAAYDEEADE